MIDALTLDQLRVLVTIADSGSFTSAAKRLLRAQSAVSHAVAKLEQQLGVPLFDRDTRRPQLTPAGSALLPEARAVLERAQRLRARARHLGSGLESEMALAVSVLMPAPRLIDLLGRFSAEFPALRFRLHVEEIGGPVALVLAGRCQLGVAGGESLAGIEPGALERQGIGAVPIVAVAAPQHPLAAIAGPLSSADVEDHRQLIPTDAALTPYPHALARETWAVADLGTRHALLLAGLGWGTMPLHWVQADLDSGRLLRLQLAARPEDAMRVPLFAIHRRSEPPGPAGRWLIEQLAEGLAL